MKVPVFQPAPEWLECVVMIVALPLLTATTLGVSPSEHVGVTGKSQSIGAFYAIATNKPLPFIVKFQSN
jgi:hypothetical protein